jgi:hypothetical protein
MSKKQHKPKKGVTTQDVVTGPCPNGQVRNSRGECVPANDPVPISGPEPCPEGKVRDENGDCV